MTIGTYPSVAATASRALPRKYCDQTEICLLADALGRCSRLGRQIWAAGKAPGNTCRQREQDRGKGDRRSANMRLSLENLRQSRAPSVMDRCAGCDLPRLHASERWDRRCRRFSPVPPSTDCYA